MSALRIAAIWFLMAIVVVCALELAFGISQ